MILALAGMALGLVALANPLDLERTQMRAALSSLPPLDVVEVARSLRVSDGPYQGAVRMGTDRGVHWYFGTLAMMEIGLRDPLIARGHVDAYLRNLERGHGAQDFVWDVIDRELTQRQYPDSHDAYAAMLLIAAVRGATGPDGDAWWDEREALLFRVARSNIRRNFRSPNEPFPGLTPTFQPGSTHPHHGGPLPQEALLMDNCEVYAALRETGLYLNRRGKREGELWLRDAERVARGIQRLFDGGERGWRVGDGAREMGDAPYPDLLAQVFPELFHVPGPSPEETIARYRAGWSRVEYHYPRWYTAPISDMPPLPIAIVALRRGHSRPAFWALDAWLRDFRPDSIDNIADVAWAAQLRRELDDYAHEGSNRAGINRALGE